MEPARWRRIEALFDEASALDSEARGPFLERECGDDVALRAEVEDMLAVDPGQSFIGTSVRRAVEAVDVDEPVPARIGPYRIAGEIGRGGLSTVFLGERDDDEYRMQVAIKLVRRGLDTADLLRRLRQERQILARLDHPQIARLLDGGSTDDGRPYVVMERIEGVSIDRYCLDHRLGLRGRLRLFVAVCEAVAYAHRNLVIHRDIKPANILVTPDGQPKLLDFGIAKLLNPDEHDPRDAALTVPGLRLLTPEYASPEQVRGETLTTATDVYSLGVLLYELLAGERPHRLEGLEASALERVICGQEPEWPSLRARGPAPSGERPVAAGRLRGDLDTIVMAALRKEPERRYPSVEQLADDIDRYLRDWPIRARPESSGYRLIKFVRRHRAAVAGAAALVTVLNTATVITARQAHIARQQREHAEAQSARAEKVSEWMVEIFEFSDPSEARGETITAREILDRAADRLVEELGDQPLDRAALAETMGRVYQGLGLYDSAQALLLTSLETRRALWGERHEDVASSLDHLAEALFEQGDYRGAYGYAARALDIRRQTLGDEHEQTLDSVNDVGALRFLLGDRVEAEALLRKNLQARRQLLGDSHESVAGALDNLANVSMAIGKLEEAESDFRQALEIRFRKHGGNHPAVVDTRADLAAVVHKTGKVEEAEWLYRRVLADQIGLLGPDHSEVATTSMNLGALLRDRVGDDGGADAAAMAEAETLLRRAIEIKQARRGPESTHVSYPLIHLADLLRLRAGSGDWDRAESLYRRALAIRRERLDAGHPDLGAPLEGLARLELSRLERSRSPSLDGAVRALELAEAAAAARRGLAESHPARRTVEALVERCRREVAALDAEKGRSG
ncbi:MAG: tetratricopeptide repeat protein [Acidobacteriota bacterium]